MRWSNSVYDTNMGNVYTEDNDSQYVQFYTNEHNILNGHTDRQEIINC